jgi:hypothetical protein
MLLQQFKYDWINTTQVLTVELCAINFPLPKMLNIATPKILRAALPSHKTNTLQILSLTTLTLLEIRMSF